MQECRGSFPIFDSQFHGSLDRLPTTSLRDRWTVLVEYRIPMGLPIYDQFPSFVTRCTLPCPTLTSDPKLLQTLPYPPTLPYPTLPYPTLPYPTLLYPNSTNLKEYLPAAKMVLISSWLLPPLSPSLPLPLLLSSSSSSTSFPPLFISDQTDQRSLSLVPPNAFVSSTSCHPPSSTLAPVRFLAVIRQPSEEPH